MGETGPYHNGSAVQNTTFTLRDDSAPIFTHIIIPQVFIDRSSTQSLFRFTARQLVPRACSWSRGQTQEHAFVIKTRGLHHPRSDLVANFVVFTLGEGLALVRLSLCWGLWGNGRCSNGDDSDDKVCGLCNGCWSLCGALVPSACCGP
jgi:hypothetical protein